MAKPNIGLLKQQYGKIYSVSIRGVDYIFRSLTFAEFDEASSANSDEWSAADAEEGLVLKAVLWPEETDFDTLPAGVVTTLANEILDVSGFTDPKGAKASLDEKREQAAYVRNIMKAFVLAAMPTYTEEQLDQYNFEQLAAKVALAEKVLEIQKAVANPNIDNITLLINDPDEEQEQAEEAVEHFNKTRQPGTATAQDPIAARLHGALG